MLFAVERILFSLKALFNFFTVSTQEVGQLQNGHGNSSHESSGIKLLLTSNQRLPDESVKEMFSYTTRRNKKTNHSSSSERYNGIMIARRWGGGGGGGGVVLPVMRYMGKVNLKGVSFYAHNQEPLGCKRNN